MRKLRVIRPRVSDQEVGADLRGLGDMQKMKDLTPEPVVSIFVQKNSKFKALEDCIQHFNATEINLDIPNIEKGKYDVLHLSLHSKQLTHKEKSIDLLAIAAIAHHEGHSVCLWQMDQFRKSLASDLETEDRATPQISNFNPSNSRFSLDGACQTYLHQAGLLKEVSAGLAEFDSHSVDQIVAELKTSHSHSVEEKKSGVTNA